MTTYFFDGTNQADTISTFDLYWNNQKYTNFQVNGNGGDDIISISIMGREGLDVVYGGDGNDAMTGYAYDSNNARGIFYGGNGTDSVYFPFAENITFTNFLSDGVVATVELSYGSNLIAGVGYDTEFIQVGNSDGTTSYYLTEDLSNENIRNVDLKELYARAFGANADWYFNNLNTYDEYHQAEALNYANLGTIENNTVNEVNGVVQPGGNFDYYFKVSNENTLYAYYQIYDFSDDLDMKLYWLNTSTNQYEVIKESLTNGDSQEIFFKAISEGNYAVRVSHYADIDGVSGASSFKFKIDGSEFFNSAIIPNDSLFTSQWHLLNTGQFGGIDNEDIVAPEGWKIRSDASEIIVAVIDSGIQTTHPDLNDNIWVNKDEIQGNGIDDDNNGYIDDINGWNFALNTPTETVDDHGTHVAGIIGAEGDNGIGATGVCWNTQIMCIDIFGGQNTASATNVINGIYYAVNNGASVINMSIGYDTDYATLLEWKDAEPALYSSYFDALNYAVNNDCCVVIAAGNSALNANYNFSVPAGFSSQIEGVISVAAISNDGDKAWYSNYGESITIAAPGGETTMSGIYSTLPNSTYGPLIGTSMASPIVAGAAALLKAENNKFTPADIENILTRSAYKSRELSSYVEDGSYLDLSAALELAKTFTPTSEDTVTGIRQGVDIYRLYNESTGAYLFSSNSNEIDLITNGGWINEGIAYESVQSDGDDVHRFLVKETSRHLYTASILERQILLQSSDYIYEGIAFQVYTEKPQGGSTVPVIRYLNTSSGVHLYSTSTTEQSILNESKDWLSEGIAWYGESYSL